MKKIIFLLLLLGSCAPQPVQQSFCSAARPITISRTDKIASETLRGIVGHNEIGARLCGWQPPKEEK